MDTNRLQPPEAKVRIERVTPEDCSSAAPIANTTGYQAEVPIWQIESSAAGSTATSSLLTDSKIYGLSPQIRGGAVIGWNVNIRRHDHYYQRDFSGARHGGVDGAMAAAMAYRDQVLQNAPPMSIREFASIVRTNNTSGVPGVSRRTEGNYSYWTAIVYLPTGKTRRRSFSVKKYGEENARAKAISARQELLEALHGWLTPYPDVVSGFHGLLGTD
ncbi:AP2 domain-containing protein [Xanthomonas campestris pv. zinniae]|nr:AP2 domain-containing protein [Xanthomonas campestris pv. zinniae]